MQDPTEAANIVRAYQLSFYNEVKNISSIISSLHFNLYTHSAVKIKLGVL